jgi:glycosyltransferase involved in cell wall biosynthesis
MKKVCIVVSQVDRVIAFEWTIEHLAKEFEFTFVLIGKKETYLSRYLYENHVKFHVIEYSGKKQAVKALYRMFFILLRGKFDVIHTHLVEATLYGLLPAWLLRIKKRIYTRHHSDYNYKYSPKGIKYDLLSNRLATDIIAITDQVKDILLNQEKVRKEKIELIHHGIDIAFFENIDVERVERLNEKYNSNSRKPVIGVIARQTQWKGVQYIIPAFGAILEKYPNALLVLANANGDYVSEINDLLKKHLPSGSYRSISYEYDSAALYKMFDIFVHVPIDEVVEAFGQVYIEALASKVPSVFTISGIASDFIKDGENALVVPYHNSESIKNAVIRLLADEEVRNKIISNGSDIVKEKFSVESFLSKLSSLYSR